MQAIEDFSRAIALDSTNALTYFNRAILRTQIGDYNRALDDYNRVAFYSPNNVLVYYNRAALYAQLGDYEAAIRDYSRAIELYPDFANAYLGRSSLRYMTNDLEGSRSDKQTAERKIAEYRSKLNDSTFSIYADTSRRFQSIAVVRERVRRQPVREPERQDRQHRAAADVQVLADDCRHASASQSPGTVLRRTVRAVPPRTSATGGCAGITGDAICPRTRCS